MRRKNLYISIYINCFMRKVLIEKGQMHIIDDLEHVYEKTITKFGTGAKIDAPKEYIGKKVYVLIRK